MEYLSDDDVNRAKENTKDNTKPQLKKINSTKTEAPCTII
jgi:hypothetical protein